MIDQHFIDLEKETWKIILSYHIDMVNHQLEWLYAFKSKKNVYVGDNKAFQGARRGGKVSLWTLWSIMLHF